MQFSLNRTVNLHLTGVVQLQDDEEVSSMRLYYSIIYPVTTFCSENKGLWTSPRGVKFAWEFMPYHKPLTIISLKFSEYYSLYNNYLSNILTASYTFWKTNFSFSINILLLFTFIILTRHLILIILYIYIKNQAKPYIPRRTGLSYRKLQGYM